MNARTRTRLNGLKTMLEAGKIKGKDAERFNALVDEGVEKHSANRKEFQHLLKRYGCWKS